MPAPVIGITMDHETNNTYSKYPWYALRENYAGSVAEMGGIPLALPHQPELVEQYLGLIDGLIITGGAFDVPPAMYGADLLSDTVVIKDTRTRFETAITLGAIKQNMPILGICGGQQLLNVVLGGTLIQHIPDVIQSDVAHEQPNPRHEIGHAAHIIANTQLSDIIRSTDILVNSAHHQAVDKAGNGVVINALAPDGVIEGIEYPAHPFCIGVQWHPEFLITNADRALYSAFIDACK